MDEEDKSGRVLFGGPSVVGSSCGLVASASYNAWAISLTNSGSRLTFKTRDLALYAGKQFTKIYADFMLLKKEQ
jgi:hypothetical protein